MTTAGEVVSAPLRTAIPVQLAQTTTLLVESEAATLKDDQCQEYDPSGDTELEETSSDDTRCGAGVVKYVSGQEKKTGDDKIGSVAHPAKGKKDRTSLAFSCPIQTDSDQTDPSRGGTITALCKPHTGSAGQRSLFEYGFKTSKTSPGDTT